MTIFWSAIINGAILSALLSVLVWFALRITPRHALNAATRHAIWWIVLSATLALPLPYAQWPLIKPARAATQSAIGLTRNPPWDTSDSQSTNTSAYTLPIQIPASQLLRPILIFWICTALLLLARVFISYATLYRRSLRAAQTPPQLNRRLEAWLTRSGSRRQGTRLAISTEIEIPIATGPFSSAVLIPAKLFESMSDEDLDQIGLHEAAHLARHDDCTLLLQRMIEAVFALHPVVRWLTRQIDLEREIACDDIVAASPEHARTYADCLTRTVALCGGVRTSLAAANVADGRSHLSRRIELLVDKTRNTRVHLTKTRLATIAIVLLAVTGLLAQTPLLIAIGAPAKLLAQLQPAPEFHPDPAPSELMPFGQELAEAHSQLQSRHFDQAIAIYEHLLTETTDLSVKTTLWTSLAEACRYKGDFKTSIAILEEAFEQLPNNASIAANLGILYESQKDNIHARQYYERSLAINPDNPLVLNNLAYLVTETGGDLDQALAYARSAQQKLPDFAEVNDTIGWIYLKKNLISDALGVFKILVDNAPNNPEFRYHYALALYKDGNDVDALTQCKTALTYMPKEIFANPLFADIHTLMDKIAPIIDTMPPEMQREAPTK